MTDNSIEAATTIAHCQDCASTVHVVHRPNQVMSIECEHSPTCPVWKGEGWELALLFTAATTQPPREEMQT